MPTAGNCTQITYVHDRNYRAARRFWDIVTSAVVVNAVNTTGHASSSSLSYNSVIRWYRDFPEVTGGLGGQSVFSGVTETRGT